jgi:hypothetical protein
MGGYLVKICRVLNDIKEYSDKIWEIRIDNNRSCCKELDGIVISIKTHYWDLTEAEHRRFSKIYNEDLIIDCYNKSDTINTGLRIFEDIKEFLEYLGFTEIKILIRLFCGEYMDSITFEEEVRLEKIKSEENECLFKAGTKVQVKKRTFILYRPVAFNK